MSRPAGTSKSWVILAYALLVLLRLYLTSQDEIIPYWADSANYAAGIHHDMWFQEQRSGVSALAWVIRELGIPYKLALDAIYVALCLVAARRVAGIVKSEALGLILFFLLAFASCFLRASLLFMADPATACAILAATLVYSRFLSAPASQWHWLDGVLGGIVLSLWALMRPEEVMILAAILLLTVLLVLLHRYHWREGWNRRALIFLLPLALMAGSGETIRLYNYQKHHLAVQSHSYGPGEMALLGALYSIPPDREIRYCPVPRSTFEAAARVSPTLRPLLRDLTDTQNGYYLYASEFYGIPGEVSGWLNFLLPQVYGRAYSLEDGSADRAMMQTAQEIRAAQAKGELKRRWASFPVDPLWRSWVPDLPAIVAIGTWNSLALHFDRRDLSAEDAMRADVLPLTDLRNYSDGLLLRSALNDRSQFDVSGVLATEGKSSSITNVLLRTDDGIIGASPVYRFTDLAHPARFNIVAHPPRDISQVELEFWNQGQLRQSVTLAVPSAEPTLVQANSEAWNIFVRHDAPDPSLGKRLEASLLRVNDLILAVGIAVCLALAACRAYASAQVQLFPLLVLVTTAISFILPRIFFYSFLFVWMKWSSLRYFCTNGPTTLFAVLAASVLVGCWIGKILRKQREEA